MNLTLDKAVRERLLLNFVYKGSVRLVEPHTYGIQHSGKEGLIGWQVAGPTNDGFRHFIVSEISGCSLTSTQFVGARPGYHRGDDRFVSILSEL